MSERVSYLDAILDRKRRENERRRGHRGLFDPERALERLLEERKESDLGRRDRALAALRRPAGEAPRVIAEIKRRSPSRGPIRPLSPGDAPRIAASYVAHGAAAVSVLADGPGFGGSPLDLRRVAGVIRAPLLYKEFVLDPIQVDLAGLVGASLVLLLVCALRPEELLDLMERCRSRGLLPLVEAASEEETRLAIDLGARAIGVNARDLRTFELDPGRAERALALVPADRVAIYMSGVESPEGLRRVAEGRADAALIGTGLMQASEPGVRLGELLRLANSV